MLKKFIQPKTITLSKTSYVHDGKTKKPTVKVVGSNGKTINSSNYTVSYASGRKNVGKYAVKITFKGNYSGTKTLYFTINPKGTSISSVSAKSKGFTVKWKKQATQTTGYQIQYSTSSKFTNAKTVTVGKNSTTSNTISKFSAKKNIMFVFVPTRQLVKQSIILLGQKPKSLPLRNIFCCNSAGIATENTKSITFKKIIKIKSN